jgi:hypothetical protein
VRQDVRHRCIAGRWWQHQVKDVAVGGTTVAIAGNRMRSRRSGRPMMSGGEAASTVCGPQAMSERRS